MRLSPRYNLCLRSAWIQLAWIVIRFVIRQMTNAIPILTLNQSIRRFLLKSLFNVPKGQDARITDESSFLSAQNVNRKIDCKHKGLPSRQTIADAFSEEAMGAETTTYAIFAVPHRWQ